MPLTNQQILTRCQALLKEVGEQNRYREMEIMQGVEGEKKHAQTVLDWCCLLTKTPSLALKIAALFHDIDRLVTPGVGDGYKGDRKRQAYQLYKKSHAQRSANFISPKLLAWQLDSSIVERVRFLIIHHDDPGSEVETLNDAELDTLVAADSLAFFTSIAPKLYATEGEERVKDKVRFMVAKMPVAARQLLAEQTLKNSIFNKLKNEAITELSL